MPHKKLIDLPREMMEKIDRMMITLFMTNMRKTIAEEHLEIERRTHSQSINRKGECTKAKITGRHRCRKAPMEHTHCYCDLRYGDPWGVVDDYYEYLDLIEA